MSERNVAERRPSKSILKKRSSDDVTSPPNRSSKTTRWDEMNIIATLHPPDKTYGKMKIEEPKTPYIYADGRHARVSTLDSKALREKLNHLTPRQLPPDDDDSDEDEGIYGTGSVTDDEELSAHERQRRNTFEDMRKKHYNEFQEMQRARAMGQLQFSDDEDDDDDDDVTTLKEKHQGPTAPPVYMDRGTQTDLCEKRKSEKKQQKQLIEKKQSQSQQQMVKQQSQQQMEKQPSQTQQQQTEQDQEQVEEEEGEEQQEA